MRSYLAWWLVRLAYRIGGGSIIYASEKLTLYGMPVFRGRRSRSMGVTYNLRGVYPDGEGFDPYLAYRESTARFR